MNSFEQELSKTFKVYKYHWHKLSVPSTPTIRFLHKPPYDFYVVHGDYFYALEAKCNTKKVTSFPFNRLEEHQRESLVKAEEENCGKSFVLINFRKPKNVMYAISIKDFLDIEESIGRKSIPISMFTEDKRFIPVSRSKVDEELVWNLEGGVII